MIARQSLHAALLSICMVLSSFAASAIAPRIRVADLRPAQTLDQSFPIEFGVWTADINAPIVLPAADVQERLDKIYNQVLARSYINAEGYRIMLSVAYGGDQADALSIHRPETCYPAQGFEVTDIRSDSLLISGRALPVTRLATQAGARFEPVTYWIVSGDQAVRSRLDARLVQLTYGFRGEIPDGLLVRVSSIDTDVDRAFRAQDAFIAALTSAMTSTWQVRLGVR